MAFLNRNGLILFSAAVMAGIGVIACPCLDADDSWLEWRGDGQGHSGAVSLPIRWDETKVHWRTPIPGLGWSTPVIAQGKAWVTTAVDVRASKEEIKRRRKLTTNSQPLVFSSEASYRVLRLDLESGKIGLDVEVILEKDPQFIQIDNSYATPSPIFESGVVYCHYGAGGMGAVDAETGKVLWTNRQLKVQHENGPGSSPILWEDLLIVHCDGIDQQYIVALNKRDGSVAWKTKRTGKLHENPQLRKSYATPLIVKVDGEEQVVSPAADWLYGYDPKTGKELWKLNYGKLGFSNSSRPVAGNGLVYVCTGFMQSQLLAIRPGAAEREAKVAWTYDKQVPAVASPILVGSELYFGSGRGVATCLDANTGRMHWSERIGTKLWASPIYGDGRLYFFDQKGTTTVLQPGTKYKRLATNALDGKIQAAGAVVDGALLVRTDKALYRVGSRQ